MGAEMPPVFVPGAALVATHTTDEIPLMDLVMSGEAFLRSETLIAPNALKPPRLHQLVPPHMV